LGKFSKNHITFFFQKIVITVTSQKYGCRIGELEKGSSDPGTRDHRASYSGSGSTTLVLNSFADLEPGAF
jgi:hypothetical protein